MAIDLENAEGLTPWAAGHHQPPHLAPGTPEAQVAPQTKMKITLASLLSCQISSKGPMIEGGDWTQIVR